ncbi:DUF4097 family beta strand repeat-containing protein [Ruminococcus sp. FC2018]|uniref:DUF4097 family beta strand repeat-containing protein n=1 Tax=Ruminococcus sp. FC2018 TaxID=1410617 RepID=UPI00048F5B49|nr:DUF4097 family beta strand repeat-containing protein [Ruminococcus sp. FC2018]
MAKYDAMGDRVQRRVPIAVWIMLLGLIISIVGVIWCVNTDLKKYIKSENLSKVQEISDIKDLEFEFDSSTIDISRSSDNNIHVEIENAPEGVYKFDAQDGKFSIHRKKFVSLIKWSGISNIPFLKDIYPQAKISVKIPDGQYGKISIKNTAGDLTITDALSCEEIEIDNGVGKLTANGIKANRSEIDNGVGEVTLKNCDLGDADVDNGVGEVSITDSTLKKTELDNGVGEINLSAEVNGDMDIDNGVGDIQIKLKGDAQDYKFKGDDDGVKIKGSKDSDDAKYKVKLDNGLGDIKIEFE